MASAKEIVHVLDLLTTGGPEALPPQVAQPALQLRKVIGSKNIVLLRQTEAVTAQAEGC